MADLSSFLAYSWLGTPLWLWSSLIAAVVALLLRAPFLVVVLAAAVTAAVLRALGFAS